MDSFEFNKIAGWILAACVAVLGLSIGTNMAFRPEKPLKPGYVVEGVVADAGDAAAAPAAEADKPIAFYLASASAEKGADVFKKCATCHNAEKGGPSGIGPNLYGVLGGPHGHMPGFAYSDAMMATKAKMWDFDGFNEWVKNPKAYIGGNKMGFAGLTKPEERAAVALYLNSKSDKPLPIPAAPAPDAGKAADTGAATAAAGAPPAGGPAAPAAK